LSGVADPLEIHTTISFAMGANDLRQRSMYSSSLPAIR